MKMSQLHAEQPRVVHIHDGSDVTKRLAVAALVGWCEGAAASGFLPFETECNLRSLIAKTLAAFNMPTKAEVDAQMEAVSREMSDV